MKILKKVLMGAVATLGLATVAACGEEDSSNLAEDVLSKVLLTQEGEKVSEDFTIPKIVKYQGNTYDVKWTSADTTLIEVKANNDSTFTADIHQPFGEDARTTLTASVEAGGKTATNDFKIKIENITFEKAVSTAISNMGIKASYGAETTVDLLSEVTEYKDKITFEYTLAAEYKSTKIENGKITYNPSLAEETVELNVTAKSGTNETTKKVTTKLSLKPVYLSVADALEVAKGEMLYVQGEIQSIASEQYGNFWIKDEAGNRIEIYGLYKGLIEDCYTGTTWNKVATRYDSWAASEKLAVGDYVYVYGQRDTFYTTEEVKNCLLMSTVKGTTPSTVKEALDEAKGTMVVLTAEVKSIAKVEYGNIYLKDSEGNEIYLYGLYQGKVSECYVDGVFDDAKAIKHGDWKAEEQVSVGDVITLYGQRDTFKTTEQIKNGVLLFVTKEAPTTPERTNVVVKPTFDKGSISGANGYNAETIPEGHTLVADLGLTDSHLSISFASGNYSNTNAGSLPGVYYDSIRLYYSKADGNGNSLTITADSGYVIEKIAVELGDKGTIADFAIYGADGITAITAENSVWTINASAFTLKNISTSTQVKVKSITVTIKTA